MSFQKSKWKFPRPSLSQDARGCNYDHSVPETRGEKLARKEARRVRNHSELSEDFDRNTAIMAGTHWVGGQRLSNGRVITRREVDRHNSLPHQSDREVARRLARGR